MVYGPQGDREKLEFLDELRSIRSVVSDKWLIIGDFNMILTADDKNNSNLNRRLMGAFRDMVQDMELKELNLKGRKFTWGSDSTQTRIDRAFCTIEWDLMLPGCVLQAQLSLVSDHCPLLIVGRDTVPLFRGFRFESFWPRMEGFKEVVTQAWAQPLDIQNPFLRLHTKLQRTATKLRAWARVRVGNVKLMMCAAKIIIGMLDVAQDYRQLTRDELHLKKDIKARLLGLAAIDKLRAKQRSRLTNIRAAEANSKLFFLQANGCRRKNHIQQLEDGRIVLTTHEQKKDCLYSHFSSHFGVPPERAFTLDWTSLRIPMADLSMRRK